MNDRSATPPPADADGLVDAGDQRMGGAFRRSLWVFAGAAVGGALIWWILRPAHAPVRVNEAAVEAPRAQAPAPVAIPPARFTDVTKASGIGFVHHNGAYGEKLLPETMGGGVAIIDVNNDGRASLLF